MSTESRFERMSWNDVASSIESQTPIALPVGAIEAHGPHLPLGTDAFIPHRLLLRLAHSRSLLVAPPLMYAAYSRPRTGGGRSFPGSTGIPLRHLEATVGAVVSDWFRQGFRSVLVVNGHYENSWGLMEALDEVVESYPDRVVVLVNWWEQLTDSDLERVFGDAFPGWEAEHASLTETSMMEALCPEMVRADLKAEGGAQRGIAYDVFPTPPDTIWPNGIGSSATGASAELGELLIELLDKRLSDIYDLELAGS